MNGVLAAIRPDDWNVALLVHVFGAMILVGGLLTGVVALVSARGNMHVLRFGYWSLLAVALPGYVAMRIGAQWVEDKEALNDLPDELVPTWIDIGYIVADAGAVLLLVSLILGGIGVRRLRDGKGATLLKITMVIALIVLAAALVAVWAMSGKPD
jgi:hypothetical protein